MNKRACVILGIDPGSYVTGYGIIETNGQRHRAIDYGCIQLPKAAPFSKRAELLFEDITHLLALRVVQAVAIEGQYVQKNAQTAMKIGMAKGVAIIAVSKKKLPLYEYPPKKAKLLATGKGNASKAYVQQMMQLLLHLPTPPSPDAADALALAICHAHHQGGLTPCSTI